MEEVDALHGVAGNDLVSLDVAQVAVEDLLADEVDDSLNVLGLLLLVRTLMQLVKVDLGEESLHDLNEKGVAEEDIYVLDKLFHA